MDVILFLLSFAIILIGCEFFTNGVEWAGKRFELSEGCVGSVLAAVGTALPETVIPIIAIFFMPSAGSSEIGVGAILGAPFMLATLALFVCGLSVLIFRKRRGTNKLHVDEGLVRRDLAFFLGAYSLAALAAFLPADMAWLKYLIGMSLIPIYIVYVWYTVRHGQNCSENEVEALYCDRIKRKCFGRTGEEIECLPDPAARGLDHYIRKHEPSTFLIIFQIILALLAIIIGANIFVQEIESLAEALNINALVLSLLIVPIATELPEKFNSFLWIREKKDTFAFGNITGAMVFQSCIPVTIGILATSWTINLNDPVQVLQAASIFIALLSASVIYLESKRREISIAGLFFGGLLYAVFIAMVFMTI
jgi:cation:H+ antiporter